MGCWRTCRLCTRTVWPPETRPNWLRSKDFEIPTVLERDHPNKLNHPLLASPSSWTSSSLSSESETAAFSWGPSSSSFSWRFSKLWIFSFLFRGEHSKHLFKQMITNRKATADWKMYILLDDVLELWRTKNWTVVFIVIQYLFYLQKNSQNVGHGTLSELSTLRWARIKNKLHIRNPCIPMVSWF